MGSKLEEGLEHIRSAEKSLKTSLLKWKPDFDTAADEYSKAAQCFRNGRSYNKARDCFILASQTYKDNRSLFHAGKSLEQAMLVSKEISQPTEIFKFAQDACNFYQQHGSPDSGSSVLEKGAKILEEKNPELALKLYQQAAEISHGEDSNLQSAEYLAKAARILVKLQMYDEAADALRRQIGFHKEIEAYGPIGRLTVAIVLVQLARGDNVAAEKAYKEWGNSCEVPEAETVEQLLQAYDDEDPDAARAALANPFIRHMDVEYSRLARCIPLPKGITVAPRAAVIEHAAAEYVSPAENIEDIASSSHTMMAAPVPADPAPIKPVQTLPADPDDDELC